MVKPAFVAVTVTVVPAPGGTPTTVTVEPLRVAEIPLVGENE